MGDFDERTVEVEAIEAIFPELEKFGAHCFSLELPVRLSEPKKVKFLPHEQEPPPEASLYETLSFRKIPRETSRVETHLLWNFPSLLVSINLPDGYPTYEPPEIKLTMQVPWLPTSKLKDLETMAWSLWEEMGHDQIVYSFIESVQENAEKCFDMADEEAIWFAPGLKLTLLEHDAKVREEKFSKETFECGVCLEPKKGIICHRMVDCGHVFCIRCLQEFYICCITEGNIDAVKCLDPGCGKGKTIEKDRKNLIKKPRKLQPNELLQIRIANDMVQRYVKLRRKRKLEANPNTLYCPRTWCQGPARVGSSRPTDETFSESEHEDDATTSKPPQFGLHRRDSNRSFEDEDGEEEDRRARSPNLRPPSECLAVCTDCSFAFCLICKRSWHGELGYCSVRNEKTFSREEKASEEYLKKYTTPCPTCNARAQKTMGCNHMVCRQCNTHFCYLCSSWLDSSNPYRHFNTLGAPCFQKLWELEGGDGEGAPARPQPPALQIVFEDPRNGQDEDRRLPNGRPVRARAPGPRPAPQPPQAVERVRIRRRVQRGLARPAAIITDPQENALNGHGLQRFLELAARDEEDGWDSDELEDQFAQFVAMDR